MIELCNKDVCTGCFACYSTCPKQAITMQTDEEGFLQPHIDIKRCIECGNCMATCPIIKPMAINSKRPLALYAICNKINSERQISASGGFFSVIAKYFMQKLHGYVCGVVFDEQFNVVHYISNNTADISKFSGSKYVQSNIRNCFIEIKKLLKQNLQVVFSGTPCQVAGLLRYLKRSYDNLTTVEVVCHGVPSPLFWKEYLKNEEFMHGKQIVNVNFKNKKFGYASSSMQIRYNDGTTTNRGHEIDYMLRAFTKNMINRNSCFNCHFKGMEHHYADFIVLDGWHIGKWNKNMNDDKGVTLVYLRTSKSEKIFNELKDDMKVQPVEIDDIYAQKDAIMLYNSAQRHSNRDLILRCLHEEGFDVMIKKYMPMTWKIRLKSKLKVLLYYTGILKVININKRLI